MSTKKKPINLQLSAPTQSARIIFVGDPKSNQCYMNVLVGKDDLVGTIPDRDILRLKKWCEQALESLGR